MEGQPQAGAQLPQELCCQGDWDDREVVLKPYGLGPIHKGLKEGGKRFGKPNPSWRQCISASCSLGFKCPIWPGV